MPIGNISFKGNLCREKITIEANHTTTNNEIDKKYFNDLLGLKRSDVLTPSILPYTKSSPEIIDGVLKFRTRSGQEIVSSNDTISVRERINIDTICGYKKSLSDSEHKTWSFMRHDEMPEYSKIFKTAVAKVHSHLLKITKGIRFEHVIKK